MSSKYDHRKTNSNLNPALAFTLTLPLPLPLPLTSNQAPDGGLDSAAKVQAKLNMFAAYEDELKGREAGVGKLTDLVGQATHLRSLTVTHLLTDLPTSRILLYYLLLSLPFALATVLTHSLARGQATDAGCPPFRQFSLQTRVANISDTMEELKEAGKEYKEGLEVELQRQLRLEEMRVSYLPLTTY